MRETIEMRGAVTLELTDAAGAVVHRQQYPNRIVKSGRRLVAELFGGAKGGKPPSPIGYVAVGSNGDAANDDQLALGNQIGDRKPIEQITYTDFDDKPGGSTETIKRTRVSVSAVFESADSNAVLREAGLFTAASGGVMYNRVRFEDVTKTTAFKLTVLWDVVF